MTRAIQALVAVAALLGGCSGGEPASQGQGGQVRPAAIASDQDGADPTMAPSPTSSTGPSSPECVPAPGRTVTELEDLTTPTVAAETVTAPAVTIDGVSIPPRQVPGFTINPQTVDAGCQVEYDAPGGCLGAIEISSVTIPSLSVPARQIPAVTLTDGTLIPAVTMPGFTIEGLTRPGTRVEQVCQIEAGRTIRFGVTRFGTTRFGLTRIGRTQFGATQFGACRPGGCLPSLSVPSVSIPSISIPSTSVESRSIPSTTLADEPDVQVVPDRERTSYLAPGDVLFETDQATLRPAALRLLRAIGTELARTPAGATILVEGHTDSTASPAYNDGLSRRRAQAVADWLLSTAGIERSRISVRGLGESAPAAPNTSAKDRQRNRRVVITVTQS